MFVVIQGSQGSSVITEGVHDFIDGHLVSGRKLFLPGLPEFINEQTILIRLRFELFAFGI